MSLILIFIITIENMVISQIFGIIRSMVSIDAPNIVNYQEAKEICRQKGYSDYFFNDCSKEYEEAKVLVGKK